MATDFKYASQTDLEMYYPNFSQYNSKRQILGWVVDSGSVKYRADDCGLVTQLFKDGKELGSAQGSSSISTNDHWYYDSAANSVYFFHSTDKAQNLLMEGGVDNATYFDQMLVNASMELNNLLDARFPMPLLKYAQYDANTAHSSATTEYDAIIIKMTCYLCVANLLRQNERTEEADYYYGLVTNPDRTGMADRLNAGEFKLSFEVTADDSKGNVRRIASAGSMEIVETAGEWCGEPYDIVRIASETTGVYGTASFKAKYYGDDKLLGSETNEIIITGGLQEVVNGLYVRFQGGAIVGSASDIWEITMTSGKRKITNASTGAIDLTRKGYGI